MRQIIVPVAAACAAIAAAALWAAYATPIGPLHHLLILGAAAAAYMALNVGANDVANNMGPAVGARAITMGAALLLAAVFEIAGALFAGQRVISTISRDLLTIDASLSGQTLILVMISALLSGAVWINGSTFFGTPVSTTHALIGGMIGAAVTAHGLDAVEWQTVGGVAVSWTLSPILGAMLAAAIHAFIRRQITRRPDKVSAARLWVPVLIGAMVGIFASYLHALNHHPVPVVSETLSVGLGFAVFAWFLAVPWIRMRSTKLENRKKQVARLFRAPLIVAAALLSFAHGANDVSNAVAPLAVILSVIRTMSGNGLVLVPLWIMVIGAVGIALGVVLFGPRVIHTVGEQITKLNEIRAFCVALAASITLLAASALGLPVSTTHVAVGAVFGVGFLREYLAIRNMHGALPLAPRGVDVALLNDTPQQAIARERPSRRRFLVRRTKIARIVTAWLVTLPIAAGLAAVIYRLLSWTLL